MHTPNLPRLVKPGDEKEISDEFPVKGVLDQWPDPSLP